MQDHRGILGAIESGREIPFEIRRVFFVYGVQGERGGHAHAATQQFIVPVAGSFTIEASDGAASTIHALDDPHRGLYVPPMTWLRLYRFSPTAVCLVLTDTSFEESVYIREWTEFVARSEQARLAL